VGGVTSGAAGEAGCSWATAAALMQTSNPKTNLGRVILPTFIVVFSNHRSTSTLSEIFETVASD
jgi:hypothetical protein